VYVCMCVGMCVCTIYIDTWSCYYLLSLGKHCYLPPDQQEHSQRSWF